MIVKKLSNPDIDNGAPYFVKVDLCTINFYKYIESLKDRKNENATH